MKIDNKCDLKSCNLPAETKNNKVSNPKSTCKNNYDKVFSNLSFGAAVSKALININDKKASEKSEIDDTISNLLFDIKKGNLKTKSTETEEAQNAKLFIMKILDKYFGNDEEYIELKKDGIEYMSMRYIFRGKNLKLDDNEKKYLSDFLDKYNKNADVTSDKKLLMYSANAADKVLDRSNETLFHISIQMQHHLPEDEYNWESVYDNFKKNTAPKLSQDELNIVLDLLLPSRNNNDTLSIKDKALFDYTLLSKRRITSFVDKHNYEKVRYYNEFLFCSDKEFEEKISKLNKRSFLKQTLNNNDMPFYLWKKLLDMSDEEYNNLAIPINKKETENFNREEYRKEIQSKIKEPLKFDKKETDILVQEYFNSSNIFCSDNNYTFKKRMDFEKLEQKNSVCSNLPSGEELLNEIKTKGNVLFKIRNKGGLNPVNNEKALIQEEDENKLDKCENARIKIKYGAKINWSNDKISRDILQNFFDGNGHTLEGTTFNIVKNSDGKYTIRIEGLGKYDYSHLQSLGDSTKDDDAFSAGNFGEGTRIVAVNLLSKPGTNYVKYGSGDWSMEFNRSSDDIKTADMTQTLTKNPENIKGNYIEFNTDNEDLVKSILNSKDYFYHPDNPDFQNLDFENEYFGFKFTPNEKGNLYLVQRYEHNGKISNSMSNLRVVFKTNPNNEELVKLNDGEEYTPNTGRDRIQISNNVLSELYSRYLKTVSDKDLVKIICTLEPCFNTNTNELFRFSDIYCLFNASINEAVKRKLGINFDNYVYIKGKDDLEYANLMGYKTAIEDMAKVGMNKVEMEEKKPFVEPCEQQSTKIRLLNEGIKVLEECTDLSTIHLFCPGEADTPKYPFNAKEYPNVKAEAIVQNREYKGHWVNPESLIMCNYINNLSTWIHELSHKSGSDNSKEFSLQLIEIEKYLMDVLVHNPVALEKIKVLAELYDNKKLAETKNFDEKSYENSVKNALNSIRTYEEYNEHNISNSLHKNSSASNFKIYKKREKEIQNAPKSTLPSTDDIINELNKNNGIVFELKDKGGLNPVNNEKALIQEEDENKLDKCENARIKIKYGAKINWSNDKISRDILQNFFDGNGHTLEGTTFNIVKNSDGKYTIRIEGLGKYDYSHLQSLGDSTKDDDAFSAGNFGEGTRIVAVNLLSKPGTNYVKYGSGDWSMEFNRSSDDIKTADMTQTLTKNPENIKGNYIEFNTDNEDLVKSILNSKDYFYHPDNPDFKNLDFENEYFGFRVQKDDGNLYYIQRFQTENGKIEGGMKKLNVIFKQQENAVKKANKKNEEKAKIKEQQQQIEQTEEAPVENKSLYGRICNFFSNLYNKIFPQQKKFSIDKISLDNISIEKGRNINFSNIITSRGGYELNNKTGINTGRDRNLLSCNDIYNLSLEYAKTMSDDDLVFAVENFEELITSDNPDDRCLNKNEKDASEAFISGIIQEAANRKIKINSNEAKLVWVDDEPPAFGSKLDTNVKTYLKEKGYKFCHKMYSKIGIKSAKEVFKNEHQKHSIEPSEKELKKLEILNRALFLFKGNDKFSYMPEISENPLRVYEKGNLKDNRDYHSIFKEGKIECMLIDRKSLSDDDFFTALTNIISETVNPTVNIISARYSYNLTDLIRLELDNFITNDENIQKLKVLEKLYKQINTQ